MLTDDSKEFLRDYVKNCFVDDRFNNRVKYLEKYLEYTSNVNNIYGDSMEDTINSYAVGSVKMHKQNISQYAALEDFMGLLSEILRLPNRPLSYERNQTNPDKNLQHLYKTIFNLFEDTFQLKDNSELSVLKDMSDTDYKFHFLNLYHYRNVTSHHQDDENIHTLDTVEINSIIRSMSYIMLYLVDQYHDRLDEIYKETKNAQIQSGFDISKYTRKIVKDYSQKQDFKYMDFRWDYLSSNKGSTIGEIINNDTENNVVIFTGEAGTGKTTALRRLEYSYANKCDNNTFDYVPVFIELKTLESGESIFHAVCDAIDIDVSAVTDILEKNKLVLLLDGLNEISAIKRRNIRNEIATLMDKNTSLQVYITDRNKQDDQFFAKQTITRYQLHELSMAEKVQYFKNNSTSQEVVDIINNAIELKDNDYRIIDNLDTPYKLHVFLKCVESSGVIPEHPISDYIDQLLDREKNEHKDDNDPEYFEHLKVILAGLAVVFDEGEFSSAKAYKVVKRVAHDLYGFEGIDSVKLVDLSVNMGILIRSEKNVLQFENSHFVYYFQDYAQDNDYDDDLKELKDDFS